MGWGVGGDLPSEPPNLYISPTWAITYCFAIKFTQENGIITARRS